MTRSRAWAPRGGWDGFSRGDDLEELAWEVLAGWHFMNPTAHTSVWESPEGTTAYLAFDDEHAVIELVIGRVGEEAEVELIEFEERLASDFDLVPRGS